MTKPSTQVGERVRHRTLSSWGIGEVVEVLPDGKLKVRFPVGGIPMVEFDDGFVFVDREAANAERVLVKETLRSKFFSEIELVFTRDFLRGEEKMKNPAPEGRSIRIPEPIRLTAFRLIGERPKGRGNTRPDSNAGG